MGFYLGVNGVVHGFSDGFCPGFYPVLTRVLRGSKWIQKLCDYRVLHGLEQIVPDTKKGSKCFKTLYVNQVLYGCQAGSKKDFKGFYLGSVCR